MGDNKLQARIEDARNWLESVTPCEHSLVPVPRWTCSECRGTALRMVAAGFVLEIKAEEDLKPRPTTLQCPVCMENDSVGDICVGMDQTSYYDVIAIDEDGKYLLKHDHDESCVDDDDGIRLFCSDCGTYFVPPDDYDTMPY